MKAVTWAAAPCPDEFYDEFVVSGALAGLETGRTLFFRTIQMRPAAKSRGMKDTGRGTEPAHALEHPSSLAHHFGGR